MATKSNFKSGTLPVKNDSEQSLALTIKELMASSWFTTSHQNLLSTISKNFGLEK